MAVDHESIPAPQVERPATEEEYYALAADEPFELLDGRLVMAPASNRHEDLFRFLLTLLSAYLDERGGAVVRGSRFAMRLDPRWSPEPDLLVVRDQHLDRLTDRCLEGPADWVLEILSSSDRRLEARMKLPRYREAGVPEIWLVDPFARTVAAEARTAAGDYEPVLPAGGRLVSRTVPGFWIDPDWLARQPLPSTLASLREILG